MATPLAEIEQRMDDAQSAETDLVALNSPSQTAIYSNWKYMNALLQYLLEVLIDLKIISVETIVKNAPVGSAPWLQAKVLEFQYDAITPQILTLVDFAPRYDPIDLTKRIITRASVKTTINNRVLVKVAKNDPPAPLTTPELNAFQSYLTNGGDGTFAGRGRGLGFAGIDIVASSIDADKLYLAGTIYYNGQYASTISASVILTINAYLASLPFDGSITLLGISDAIQAVTGVNNILLTDVAVRADATLFANKTYMRQTQTDIITVYPTYAGYIVEETTGGETFADKLIFTTS